MEWIETDIYKSGVQLCTSTGSIRSRFEAANSERVKFNMESKGCTDILFMGVEGDNQKNWKTVAFDQKYLYTGAPLIIGRRYKLQGHFGIVGQAKFQCFSTDNNPFTSPYRRKCFAEASISSSITIRIAGSNVGFQGFLLLSRRIEPDDTYTHIYDTFQAFNIEFLCTASGSIRLEIPIIATVTTKGRYSRARLTKIDDTGSSFRITTNVVPYFTEIS